MSEFSTTGAGAERLAQNLRKLSFRSKDESLERLRELSERATPGSLYTVVRDDLPPVEAIIDDALAWRAECLTGRARNATLSARIESLETALRPFAEAAREFSSSIGPDGIDDDLVVTARIHARPEREARLSTGQFHAARVALNGAPNVG